MGFPCCCPSGPESAGWARPFAPSDPRGPERGRGGHVSGAGPGRHRFLSTSPEPGATAATIIRRCDAPFLAPPSERPEDGDLTRGTVTDSRESNGVIELVLELVEGPTLAGRIAQGPIPLDEALPIASGSPRARSDARVGHHSSRSETRERRRLRRRSRPRAKPLIGAVISGRSTWC